MLVNTLRKSLLATVAALSILPALAQVAQAQSNDDVYGAIAYSQSTGVYTSALGSSEKEAENQAYYDCQQKSGADDCKVPLWFKNAWGAIAVGSNGAYGTGWGYDKNNPEHGRDIAGQYALETCNKYGGTDCQVIYSTEAR
jgi:serine/threonine-protein kinase